jgi:DNA-binding response OmpR family regulator
MRTSSPRARAHVLVVDDSSVVRGMVRTILERGGLDVREASDGREALRILFTGGIDLVLLDVEMPGLDGWQTLERLREVSEVPVCMLTGQDGELAKVRGLRAGADDYVAKPFGKLELLARVEALLRRSGVADDAGGVVERYEDGVVSVDHHQRLVIVDGREVPVTPTEYALMSAFVRNAGQVLSPDQLAELALGGEDASAQVKLYVSRLRRKLAEALGDDAPIETLRGFGYRYRPAVAA